MFKENVEEIDSKKLPLNQEFLVKTHLRAKNKKL